MKKAFLVTFSVRTRVVADVPEGFNPDEIDFSDKPQAVAFDAIVAEARDHVLENPYGYLCPDNIEVGDGIVDDDECPYGTFNGEE